MSRFSLRKNRALISGILSACCCPFVQQYVKADDRQDAEDLLTYVESNLFLFNKDYKDKNNYSLISTAVRAYGKDKGISFVERAKNCYNYIFSYYEKNKCDITCWTSSLALIHFINLWYEENINSLYKSDLLDPRSKPRFYLGLFSYPIRFTNQMANHTGVCVILGQYCLLFDPIVGKISGIIDLEESNDMVLASLYSFFDAHGTRIGSEEEESGGFINKLKSRLGGVKNKVTDFFAGSLDVPAEKRQILLSENYITSKHKSLGNLSFVEFYGFLLNYTKTLDEDISEMFERTPASFLFQFV